MQKKGYVLTYLLLNSNKVLNHSFQVRLFYSYISFAALGYAGFRMVNYNRKLTLHN